MFEELDIVLMSSSPRRAQILKEADIKFRVYKPEIIESYPEDLQPLKVPSYLSEQKILCSSIRTNVNTVLIAADTVVISEGHVLGKPKNKDDAYRMICSLSGKEHVVVTGLSLSNKNEIKTYSTCTKVSFFSLSEKDIEYYVDKYKPFDKAGAYGIQEWLGVVGVKSINGCYYNVMGLPMSKLYQELRLIGAKITGGKLY